MSNADKSHSVSNSPELRKVDIQSYHAGWSDAKAGRQYGEGRNGLPLDDISRWLVPEAHRPTCALSGEPCTSWTCLVDTCVGSVDSATEGLPTIGEDS